MGVNQNILLAGVGGQGTVLASKLLAQCAMDRGLKARTAETIGMAQRGGCVVSHVRMGEEIFSPLIPVGSADVILGFEPAEAVRVLPYLKQGGAVVVSSRAVKPVTDSLAGGAYTGEEMLAYLHAHVQNLVVIDGEAVCQACGSSRVLNVALLGAAAGKGVLPFSSQEMEKALEQRLPARFLEMNRKAFSLGEQAAGVR